MRALLHVVNVVLVLPAVALAAAFLLFGTAVASGSWLGFFGVLLDTAAWLLPWGLLVSLISLLLLLFGGLTVRFRLLASLSVAVLAAASATIVLATVFAHGNFSVGQFLFFAPALISASLGLWLAASERRRPDYSLKRSDLAR